MFKIQTLDRISAVGLDNFPRDEYEIASEIVKPDAILVRSHDMLSMEIDPNIKAVARAGAGVNNIPVKDLAQKGVVVFNTPGANVTPSAIFSKLPFNSILLFASVASSAFAT